LKIAFTADNHLTTLARHPQRFQALGDIFQQCGKLQVQLLVIAGDLFDQALANYADFEKLYRETRPRDLKTIIIPGNHDPTLQGKDLAGDGLVVYHQPTLQPLNDSRQMLFLPYLGHQSMGEGIAPFAEALTDQRWILVSHGDYTAGQQPPDPYEPGVYMPLTRPDLAHYQPELVFLGHIHRPQREGIVHYPGSPCPVDITETGTRRFLILDTQQGEVTSHPVNSSLVYFDESFLIIPGENELEGLRTEIENRIQAWDLPPGWESQTQVRVRIYGSATSSRSDILALAEECFAPYAYYQDQPPALDQLLLSLDEDKAEIAAQMQAWVNALDWKATQTHPDKTHILQEALRIIYQA
jgi:DNA repair exonuclease SbcCD nuclease subunit